MRTSKRTVLLSASLVIGAVVALKAATQHDSPRPRAVVQDPPTPFIDAALAKQRAARTATVDDAKAFTPVLANDEVPVWKRKYPFATVIDEDKDEDAIVLRDVDGSESRLPNGPRVIAGATSIAEMVILEPELNDELAAVTASMFDEFVECGRALVARRGPLDVQTKWVMGLRWVGDGKTLRVVDVVSDPAHWPAIFDDEAKACWTRTITSTLTPSVLVVDRLIESTFCVYPKPKEGNP